MWNSARQNVAGNGSSTPIEKYLDGKITKDSYFREVKKETARQVDHDLKSPRKKQPAT